MKTFLDEGNLRKFVASRSVLKKKTAKGSSLNIKEMIKKQKRESGIPERKEEKWKEQKYE